MIAITGNTYPVKDQLRALGAKWNPDKKVWMIADDKAEQAKAIVASAPAKSASGSNSYRPGRCKACGARPGPRGWPRIYRNGICSDCYADDADDDY